MASGLQKLRDRQKAHGLSDLERPHGRPRRRAGSFRHLMGGGRRHHSASIDGLPSEEARALRDRMTELAEGKDAAL